MIVENLNENYAKVVSENRNFKFYWTIKKNCIFPFLTNIFSKLYYVAQVLNLRQVCK